MGGFAVQACWVVLLVQGVASSFLKRVFGTVGIIVLATALLFRFLLEGWDVPASAMAPCSLRGRS